MPGSWRAIGNFPGEVYTMNFLLVPLAPLQSPLVHAWFPQKSLLDPSPPTLTPCSSTSHNATHIPTICTPRSFPIIRSYDLTYYTLSTEPGAPLLASWLPWAHLPLRSRMGSSRAQVLSREPCTQQGPPHVPRVSGRDSQVPPTWTPCCRLHLPALSRFVLHGQQIFAIVLATGALLQTVRLQPLP